MKNLQSITVHVSMNGKVERVTALWAISGEVDGYVVATGQTADVAVAGAALDAAGALVAAIQTDGVPPTEAEKAEKVAALSAEKAAAAEVLP